MKEHKLLQVETLLKKDILLSPDLLNKIDDLSEEALEAASSTKLVVLNKDIEEILSKNKDVDVNWLELEKSKVLFEKEKNTKVYLKFIEFLLSETTKKEKVSVVSSYEIESKKRSFEDFVALFNSRYQQLKALLRNRQELENLMSINRINNKREKGKVSLIGMVQDKRVTKNNNIILTLEDPTGTTNVLISRSKQQLIKDSQSIVRDEVLGIVGVNNTNIVYANSVVWPDIPTRELKKAPDRAYALFLSDLHVGSKNFLPQDFDKFLKWLNQGLGNRQQKEIAQKTKYLFIVGDLVDGIAVYPEQDEELEIKDLKQQYKACTKLLSEIPQDIRIIICPGNHDGVRMSEPQPALSKGFANQLLKLPNILSVSNPALVNIHASQNFVGFDVLMYHGYSFDYYVANVDSIRQQGGYDRADLIMRFLLRRRHLAPTYSSTLPTPAMTDHLVIESVPDIFVTGHIHKSSVSSYRNVTTICGSCWQSKTAFQERVGHNPEPSRVPIIDLQTRKVKILKFGT
jgi:DNA polymerase II small subunit